MSDPTIQSTVQIRTLLSDAEPALSRTSGTIAALITASSSWPETCRQLTADRAFEKILTLIRDQSHIFVLSIAA